MAQNEMRAKPALPERVRSMEGLAICPLPKWPCHTSWTTGVGASEPSWNGHVGEIYIFRRCASRLYCGSRLRSCNDHSSAEYRIFGLLGSGEANGVQLNGPGLGCTVEVSLNIVAIAKCAHCSVARAHLFCDDSICLLVGLGCLAHKRLFVFLAWRKFERRASGERYHE